MPSPSPEDKPRSPARVHLSITSLLTGLIGTLWVVLACGGTPSTPPAPTPAPYHGPAARPAAAQPTRSAGCAKDMDCKGDRVCDDGACVDPK